jgi:hypothetical protein
MVLTNLLTFDATEADRMSLVVAAFCGRVWAAGVLAFDAALPADTARVVGAAGRATGEEARRPTQPVAIDVAFRAADPSAAVLSAIAVGAAALFVPAPLAGWTPAVDIGLIAVLDTVEAVILAEVVGAARLAVGTVVVVATAPARPVDAMGLESGTVTPGAALDALALTTDGPSVGAAVAAAAAGIGVAVGIDAITGTTLFPARAVAIVPAALAELGAYVAVDADTTAVRFGLRAVAIPGTLRAPLVPAADVDTAIAAVATTLGAALTAGAELGAGARAVIAEARAALLAVRASCSGEPAAAAIDATETGTAARILPTGGANVLAAAPVAALAGAALEPGCAGGAGPLAAAALRVRRLDLA